MRFYLSETVSGTAVAVSIYAAMRVNKFDDMVTKLSGEMNYGGLGFFGFTRR